jgi:glycolate oxidase iron-sulfur subunit
VIEEVPLEGGVAHPGQVVRVGDTVRRPNRESIDGMRTSDDTGGPVGGDLPAGTRFIGPEAGAVPGWFPGRDAPVDADLASCVACGLCLPHCPTYRLTGEESASPRGRIAAMREVADGRGVVDDTFASFMDLCLSCRACEDVCPSHVPFGRMMEASREQVEPLRSRRARLLRWLGLEVALPRKKLLWLAAALQPLASPFLPGRVRAMVPRRSALFQRLPAVTPGAGEERGTVALLSGCVQDRWFREVNLATIRVLARNGWRVNVPRAQACCGALSGHNGRLATARTLARRNARAFAGADHVIVNSAGCAAHMADATGEDALPVRDLMAFLAEEGLRHEPGELPATVAYHDACHALRVLKVRDQPRALLRRIPGLEVTDLENGDRCCGAAGLYNVTQPEMSGELRRQKAEAVTATGAAIVASANPGCTMQLVAGLRELDADVEVVHPVQLLDRAYGEL